MAIMLKHGTTLVLMVGDRVAQSPSCCCAVGCNSHTLTVRHTGRSALAYGYSLPAPNNNTYRMVVQDSSSHGTMTSSGPEENHCNYTCTCDESYDCTTEYNLIWSPSPTDPYSGWNQSDSGAGAYYYRTCPPYGSTGPYTCVCGLCSSDVFDWFANYQAPINCRCACGPPITDSGEVTASDTHKYRNTSISGTCVPASCDTCSHDASGHAGITLSEQYTGDDVNDDTLAKLDDMTFPVILPPTGFGDPNFCVYTFRHATYYDGIVDTSHLSTLELWRAQFKFFIPHPIAVPTYITYRLLDIAPPYDGTTNYPIGTGCAVIPAGATASDLQTLMEPTIDEYYRSFDMVIASHVPC